MKKKIRVLVPTFILETLERDCEFFGLTKEKLCNEIFLKFSLKFRSRYQDDMIFENKEYLQFTLNKANQRYYADLLKELAESNDSEIVREIFSTYSVLAPFLREIYLFREKIIFLHSSMKEYRVLRVDTQHGIVEGRISRIYRCQENNYLKIDIEEQSYYVGQTRVIS